MTRAERKDASALLLQALGSTIHEQRTSLDITQEALAVRCGLHRTYISDIERGARNPSLITIHRIATAFGMTVSNLLTAADEIMIQESSDNE